MDDDVVAVAVGFGHRLIELVNQAEEEPVVLTKQGAQRVPGAGPRCVLVDDAAADERPPDLSVQIFAVGHDDEGEVAGDDAAHFLGEEGHRVGLAAALRVPEDAQAAGIRVRAADQRQIGFDCVRIVQGPVERIARWPFGRAEAAARHRILDGAPLGRRLAFQRLLMQHGRDGVVDAEHLMVASDNLAGAAGAAVVEEDEVLDQIEKR